jgi:hypothetical protein
MVTSYLGRIAGIVARGQKTGRIRRDLDPRAVALMFLGLIQPASILWHLSSGSFDVEGQVEKAWPVFRKAISRR